MCSLNLAKGFLVKKMNDMTTELKLQFLEEKLGKDKVNHLLAILKTILPYFTEVDCINRLYLEEFKEQ